MESRAEESGVPNGRGFEPVVGLAPGDGLAAPNDWHRCLSPGQCPEIYGHACPDQLMSGYRSGHSLRSRLGLGPNFQRRVFLEKTLEEPRSGSGMNRWPGSPSTVVLFMPCEGFSLGRSLWRIDHLSATVGCARQLTLPSLSFHWEVVA